MDFKDKIEHLRNGRIDAVTFEVTAANGKFLRLRYEFDHFIQYLARLSLTEAPTDALDPRLQQIYRAAIPGLAILATDKCIKAVVAIELDQAIVAGEPPPDFDDAPIQS